MAAASKNTSNISASRRKRTHKVQVIKEVDREVMIEIRGRVISRKRRDEVQVVKEIHRPIMIEIAQTHNHSQDRNSACHALAITAQHTK